jgi:hypothetical protein
VQEIIRNIPLFVIAEVSQSTGELKKGGINEAINPHKLSHYGCQNLTAVTLPCRGDQVPLRVSEFYRTAVRAGNSLGAHYVLVPQDLRHELGTSPKPPFNEFSTFSGLVTFYLRNY